MWFSVVGDRFKKEDVDLFAKSTVTIVRLVQKEQGNVARDRSRSTTEHTFGESGPEREPVRPWASCSRSGQLP